MTTRRCAVTCYPRAHTSLSVWWAGQNRRVNYRRRPDSAALAGGRFLTTDERDLPRPSTRGLRPGRPLKVTHRAGDPGEAGMAGTAVPLVVDRLSPRLRMHTNRSSGTWKQPRAQEGLTYRLATPCCGPNHVPAPLAGLRRQPWIPPGARGPRWKAWSGRGRPSRP
jgi:hypothetical protein